MKKRIRKLLDDQAFEDYAAVTKERNFNAFDVLRYSDYEIRHSNVLAWLLTPGETHGVGDTFLRKVGECLRNKDGEDGDAEAVDTKPVKKHGGKLKGLDMAAGFAAEEVRVERERDYVDVMVFLEKEPKVLLVVENKPCRRTSDHVKQLRGYVEKQCEEHGASYSVQGVLLTASRSGDPKHKDYLHLSWHEVRRFVGSLLEEGCVSSAEVKAFLRQYVDIVDRNILGLGPSSDGFRRLLKNHGQTLERMLREWRPGAVPACWRVPPADEDAVDRLMRDLRQRPAALRVRVKELLQGEDFKTGLSAARGGTAYWLSFWDDCWSKLTKHLGLPDLGWSFQFTHRGVAVLLSGGRVTGDQRITVREMMDFMRTAPVLGVEGGEFTLRIDTLGYASFYRKQLLTEADFADASPEEIQGRTMTEAREFLNSPAYKRINRYFEVLAFSPSRR